MNSHFGRHATPPSRPSTPPSPSTHVRCGRPASSSPAASRPEIPETRLVRRNRYYVDAETDRFFLLKRGVVFEPGRATVGYVRDGTPLRYDVTTDDTIVFLEEPKFGRTWSEIVERKARR